MSTELVRYYERAGDDFLAYRLQHVFTRVVTAEQQALHNDMMDEIEKMTEGNRNELLLAVARKIIEVSNGGKENTKEKTKRSLFGRS